MKLLEILQKAKYGLQIRDPLDAALSTLYGGASASNIARDLGYDYETQEKFGIMGLLNNSMSQVANLRNNLREVPELEDEYHKTPNPNMYDASRQVSTYKEGGLYSEVLNKRASNVAKLFGTVINYRNKKENDRYKKENKFNLLNFFEEGGQQKEDESSTDFILDSTFKDSPISEALKPMEIEDESEVRDTNYEYTSNFSSSDNNSESSFDTKGMGIAASHYNPGNIKFGSFAKKLGATKGSKAQDGGHFAVFPSIETGLVAQAKLLTSKNYRNLTVDAAMKRWSNKGYGGEISPEIKYKTMKDLTGEELKDLVKNQIRREDVRFYKKLLEEGYI